MPVLPLPGRVITFNPMKRFCLFFTFILLATHLKAQDTTQQIIRGLKNSLAQQQKPYVVLISVDGFRYDYADRFNAENLQRLSGGGVRATAMQPSFPSLTFPNHYSLITGLYPAHHGLVDNTFYDRKRKEEYRIGSPAVTDGSWYGGTPLWVLAAQQQMVSASYFWVASEAEIQGIRPAYYYKYHEKTGIDQRIQTVVNWLKLPAEDRPHLITFYFPEVDHAGHRRGPESDSTRKMVKFVDQGIARLVKEVDKLHLQVNYILVSDHGMTMSDTVTAHKIVVPRAFTAGSTVTFGNEKIMLYNNNEQQVRETYDSLKRHQEHYTVYLKQEMPARWHYGQEDQYDRIGDIVLVAEPGYLFYNDNPTAENYPGHHGYDNNLADMHAVFMAWGPAFKPHFRTGTFENVHVYPLVAELLGLRITAPIDGKLAVLKSILK